MREASSRAWVHQSHPTTVLQVRQALKIKQTREENIREKIKSELFQIIKQPSKIAENAIKIKAEATLNENIQRYKDVPDKWKKPMQLILSAKVFAGTSESKQKRNTKEEIGFYIFGWT